MKFLRKKILFKSLLFLICTFSFLCAGKKVPKKGSCDNEEAMEAFLARSANREDARVKGHISSIISKCNMSNQQKAILEINHILLESKRLGIDVNSVNGKGFSFLHRAVSAEKLLIVRFLVEQEETEINLNPEYKHQTPLDMAEQKENHEIFEYLKFKGAKTWAQVHGYEEVFEDEDSEEEVEQEEEDEPKFSAKECLAIHLLTNRFDF